MGYVARASAECPHIGRQICCKCQIFTQYESLTSNQQAWGFESLRARQRKRPQGFRIPLGSFVFARWVSEATGSIIETQDALGHRSAATTRVYVQRVAVKKDRHSTSILDRLDVQVPDLAVAK